MTAKRQTKSPVQVFQEAAEAFRKKRREAFSMSVPSESYPQEERLSDWKKMAGEFDKCVNSGIALTEGELESLKDLAARLIRGGLDDGYLSLSQEMAWVDEAGAPQFSLSGRTLEIKF